MWAGCFRIGAPANTNTYVEAFHHVLKDVYFNKKQNRRIDCLLVMLMKYAKDQILEQAIKLEKGKVTHRLREIRNRHKSAHTVTDVRKTSNEEVWVVPSATTVGVEHTVKRVTQKEMCQCKLVCDRCKVCVHMYTCTCTDFLLRACACKHIHAVHMTNNQDDSFHAECATENADQLSFLQSVLGQDTVNNSSNVSTVRNAAINKASEIIDFLKSEDDIGIIKTVSERLNTALSVGQGMQLNKTKQEFQAKRNFCANKKFETQPRFFSTKRNSLKAGPFKLKKPGAQDNKPAILETLSNMSPNVCSLCFKENDTTDTDEIAWVECSTCKSWVHLACDIHITDTDYVCAACRK